MTGTRGRGYSETSVGSENPRLRGRTCAIPFETVWQAARRIADGGIRGWSLQRADDQEGVIHATSRSLRGAEHDIVIRISLDENAQTRVDASAASRKPTTDFGAASRRVLRFFRELDTALAQKTAHSTRRGT